MHKIAKDIMDRIKAKIEVCGVDSITEQELIEMKYWTCIADAMTSYDYHMKALEEMEKSEDDERFYSRMRGYSSRSYEPYLGDIEHNRDMDRAAGKMYYSGAGSSSSMGYESRYDSARRGYEESKANDPNHESMQQMQEIFEALEGDIKKLKTKMSATEKSFAKNKLMNMSNIM